MVFIRRLQKVRLWNEIFIFPDSVMNWPNIVSRCARRQPNPSLLIMSSVTAVNSWEPIRCFTLWSPRRVSLRHHISIFDKWLFKRLFNLLLKAVFRLKRVNHRGSFPFWINPHFPLLLSNDLAGAVKLLDMLLLPGFGPLRFCMVLIVQRWDSHLGYQRIKFARQVFLNGLSLVLAKLLVHFMQLNMLFHWLENVFLWIVLFSLFQLIVPQSLIKINSRGFSVRELGFYPYRLNQSWIPYSFWNHEFRNVSLMPFLSFMVFIHLDRMVRK